jgi:hypothetical protein
VRAEAAYVESAHTAHEVVETRREDEFIVGATEGRRLVVCQAELKVDNVLQAR